MSDVLAYEFMQNALLAGLLASLACGVIGSYVVVKRIVFISGGIAHTAYGGVGLGYLLGISPLWGATGFSLLAAFSIGLVSRRLGQSSDTIIGVIWAVGMALGILFVNLAPGAAPNLMTYLFGSILTVSRADVFLMLALVLAIFLTVGLFYKEFLAVTFDEEFSTVLGVRVEAIYLLLLGLVALTVVILIRVVGIILVIALLTLPPATARLFVRRLAPMMSLATVVGILCTISGLFLSYRLNEFTGKPFPSGPVIILVTATVYLLALVARRWSTDPDES